MVRKLLFYCWAELREGNYLIIYSIQEQRAVEFSC